MTLPKNTYSCLVSIINNKGISIYKDEEKAAANAFMEFLADKDYGTGKQQFRFFIYVEPDVNIGKHRDFALGKGVQLSAHVDYEKFVSADSTQRHKYVLNTTLVLCKYFADKLAVPKNFDIARLIKEYTTFLNSRSLLLTDKDVDEFVIKPFEATKFYFDVTTTSEVKDRDIHYDLIKISDYLNNQLSGKTFGKSVQEFVLGYEISDFQGYMKPSIHTANVRIYGAKNKYLLIVKQFDYQKLKNKTHLEQFNILKGKILEAIDDVDKLNRKPKDFDKQLFHGTIEQILTDYSIKYCH